MASLSLAVLFWEMVMNIMIVNQVVRRIESDAVHEGRLVAVAKVLSLLSAPSSLHPRLSCSSWGPRSQAQTPAPHWPQAGGRADEGQIFMTVD